jgi:hypothetical protein
MNDPLTPNVDPMNDPLTPLLIDEVSQAWTHYRHLEETRTKYLSFFAATTLTSVGFLVTLSKDATTFDQVQLALLTSVFLFFLFMFSAFVWANVLRIGYVLAAYEDILRETRRYRLAAYPAAVTLWDIRSRLPETVRGGIFSIQQAAIYMIMSVCFFIMVAQSYLSALVLAGELQSKKWFAYPLPFWLLPAIMLVALVYAVICISRANAQRKRVSALDLSLPRVGRTENGI